MTELVQVFVILALGLPSCVAWTMVAVMYVSIATTLFHVVDEVCGAGGPLWDALGRVAGVRVPDGVGFIGLAVLLPAALAAAAVYGYVGDSEVALSLLVGARLGDALFSHFGPWALRLIRPNPGLPSACLYVVEGGAVACFLPVNPWVAVAAGLGFAAVVPALWLAGQVGLLAARAAGEGRTDG